MPDTFDRFTPRDRGLFGDNERAPSRPRSPRVTGTSNIIDLDLVFHHATDNAVLVSASGDEGGPSCWPKNGKLDELGCAVDQGADYAQLVAKFAAAHPRDYAEVTFNEETDASREQRLRNMRAAGIH